MYLILLGLIAVGAGLLLVYYSIKDKNKKNAVKENWEPEEKGKVIYLFDDEKEDGSGFVDPKSDMKKEKTSDKVTSEKPEEPTEKDD